MQNQKIISLKSKIKKYFLILFLIVFSTELSEAQQVFNSFDSLLNYVSQKSITLNSGEIKLNQAQKAKLLSIAGIADLNGSVSMNITDNTKLPVSLFPAEAFGGTPGTYQEIQTGIQYSNNFSQYAEVKLINASGWQNFKLAKINIEITESDNNLTKKTLFENIAVIYFNIISLQEQLSATRENIKTTDTLLQVVKNKFDLGLASQQHLNEAQVNSINTIETANQIEYLIQQQYIAFKILGDIPNDEIITINQTVDFPETESNPTIELNNLNLTISKLKEKSALTYYNQLKTSTLPSLSAFVSNGYQQYNPEFSLFDKNIKWTNSNYIGLKLSWNIPNSSTLTQISKAKSDYYLAKENTNQTIIHSELENKQLIIDYEKANSQMKSYKQIFELQTDTYNKNFDNYKEGILSIDILLNSYNSMVNSHYNYISALVNIMLSKSKININNEIL